MDANQIKLYVADSETCWATQLTKQTARVENIPADGVYNIDDVVTVGQPDGPAFVRDGRPVYVALDLVTRVYQHRYAFRHATWGQRQIDAFAAAAVAAGCKSENFTPRLAALACNSAGQARDLATQFHCAIEQGL